MIKKRIIWIVITAVFILAIIHILATREKTGRLQGLKRDSYVESYSPSGPVVGNTSPTEVTGELYVTPKQEGQ